MLAAFFAAWCFVASVSAQDIHFSQFFATPLLNPANSGRHDGRWRAGLNYRNQWQSVTAPWRTFDLYGDMRVGDVDAMLVMLSVIYRVAP